MSKLPKWTPFEEGVPIHKSETQIAEMAKVFNTTPDLVRAAIARENRESQLFLNSRYQVALTRQKSKFEGEADLVWLSIKRLDKQPVGVERFRDFQRIKNELVGPEYEAVELYPAEERLVDTANQYHLWIIADPKFRYPFGFDERAVIGESMGGAVQKPFED